LRVLQKKIQLQSQVGRKKNILSRSGGGGGNAEPGEMLLPWWYIAEHCIMQYCCA
jgi:hypothetical protein